MDVSGLALRALFLAAAVHAYVSTVHAYALERYDVILKTLKSMMNLPSASNTNHLGVQTYGALAVEPVPGVTPGMVPAVPGYFRRIREICDRHGGLPILDKGICGMCRTGTLFACNQEGITPDIADIAKGLGAGSQPVGAMLCTASMTPSKRAVAPSRTDTPSWPGTGRSRGRRSWAKGSRRPCARPLASPHVGDIRGQNLFRGIEQAKDRASRPTFRPSAGPMPGSRPPLSRPGCSAIRWAAPLTGGRAIRFCWPRPSPLTALMLLKSRISCNSRWQPCGEPPRLAPCHQEALELRRILIFIQAENRKRAVEPPASDHVGSPPQRKSVRCPARCVSMS